MPEENVHVVERPRRRARGLPRAGPRLAPRLLLRRHDALRGRRGRRADPAEPRACCRRRRRRTSTSRRWYRTIEEIERRAPERLALIHFGLADDVSRHLGELRERLDTLGRTRVEAGATEEEFVAAAKADLPPDEADELRPRDAVLAVLRGLERYWEQRVRASPRRCASASSAFSSSAARSRSSAARSRPSRSRSPSST